MYKETALYCCEHLIADNWRGVAASRVGRRSAGGGGGAAMREAPERAGTRGGGAGGNGTSGMDASSNRSCGAAAKAALQMRD